MQRKFRSPRSDDSRGVASPFLDRISDFTVRRLSSYCRILRNLETNSASTVSSAKLAELCGVTSAQVRKDLSYFGNFGTRGLGYQVSELKTAIEKIMGLHRQWSVALFGAGSLGHALFFHEGFREDGFYFRHVFEVDPLKVGKKWQDVEIRPIEEAESRLKRIPVDIAVVATPSESAQEIVDLVVGLGVKAIMNFAPRKLNVPDNVGLRNVNLAVALESLSFFLSN
ncbi:MAG: redox-sensing transcriptional repressor Rex [bacterium]|nr:redox-sensing transcriptional repressor Rex [bacterium]